MPELLIWGVLSTLITVGVGAAIVVVDRRRRREALELALLDDMADRVEAMEGVAERLVELEARLELAERQLRSGERP